MCYLLRNRKLALIIKHVLHMEYLIWFVWHPIHRYRNLLYVLSIHFKLQNWMIRFKKFIVGILWSLKTKQTTIWLSNFCFIYFQSINIFQNFENDIIMPPRVFYLYLKWNLFYFRTSYVFLIWFDFDIKLSYYVCICNFVV